jgi:hypothetical protein
MRAMVLLRCSDEISRLGKYRLLILRLRRVFEALRMNNGFEIKQRLYQKVG